MTTNLRAESATALQILGNTSISEHLWEWKRKETCNNQKETCMFEYLLVVQDSTLHIINESKIVHPWEKSCVIFEQSSTPRTAKSARWVACARLRGLGHPARALDWVPRIILFFPFFLSDHSLFAVRQKLAKIYIVQCDFTGKMEADYQKNK